MNWESGGKFVLGKKQSVEDQLIQCSASGDLTLKLETNVSWSFGDPEFPNNNGDHHKY